MNTRRTAQHADVAEVEVAVLATLSGEVSAHVRRRIRRAAELQALADRARSQALDGAEFDIAELNKLETVAADAMVALDLPKTQHRIECTFINQEPLALDRLDDEELAQLESLLRKMGAKEADVVDAPLRTEVEQLRTENAKLRERLDALEVRNSEPGAGGRPRSW